MPFRVWYMGDMPHGWAAAEFMLLLREILFFEAGEDDNRELYMPRRPAPLAERRRRALRHGDQRRHHLRPRFGYTLVHDERTGASGSTSLSLWRA